MLLPPLDSIITINISPYVSYLLSHLVDITRDDRFLDIPTQYKGVQYMQANYHAQVTVRGFESKNVPGQKFLN